MIDEEKSFVATCKFLLWLFTAFVISFIGISGVFAETITDMTFSQFRTTVNSYGINSNQYIYDTTSAVPVNMGFSPNGFAFEWITNYTNKCSGQTIINGQMAIPNDNLNYDWLEENIKDIYYAPNINGVDGTACTYSISPSNMIISFTCSTVQPNNNFIIGGHLKYRTNTNFNTYFRIYRTFNITCDNSASAIIDNQSQNTQNIINNNNNNTQDIINNNDENTNKIIDENKKNFNDCRDSINLWGNLNWQSGTYSYFKLPKENTYYTLSMKLKEGKTIPAGLYVRFTNTGDYGGNDMSFTTIIGNGQFSSPYIINFTNNTFLNYLSVYPSSYQNNLSDYFDIMLNEGTTPLDYEPYGKEICVNKLDEQNKTSKGIFGKLKDLFDTLFSNDDADVSGLDNMVGWLPPGPVDSIINLPLSLFNSLTNTLTGTCTPVSLTIPFVNQTLVLPCFDAYMSQYLTGFNTLWTFVGVTLSVFILYYYLLALYKWVDDTLTFRENNLPGYYGDNWGGGA